MTTSGTENDDRIGADVVVLGAGFSKAICESLPTTDELGDDVRERLASADQKRLPPSPFTDGRFEEWLSYLAEPQPHLGIDQSYEAMALLHRVTNAMHDVLSAAQLKALATSGQEWLFQLLAVLHRRRAVVATLNYDNLLECGLAGGWLTVPGGVVSFVEEDDVLNGLPPLTPALEQLPAKILGDEFGWTGGSYAQESIDTLQLLKLHGSLSWYWVPGDTSGLTLQRWQLPGAFGAPMEDNVALRARALPRRQAFIVPPTALKSQHLSNPVISELWHRAAIALKRTTRVALLGYSLPLADRSFSEMLAEGVRGRAVTFEVVNTKASGVVSNLEHLGIEKATITTHTGADCIAEWVSSQVTELATKTVSDVEGGDFEGQELIGVSGLLSLSDVVTLDGSDLVLTTVPTGSLVANQPRVGDVLGSLAEANRIVVDVGNRRLPVIGFEVFRQPNVQGASLDRVQFTLAGRP